MVKGFARSIACFMVLGFGACSEPDSPFRMICTAEVSDDCFPPAEIEELLVARSARIVHAEPTPAGGNGAQVLTLEVPWEGQQVRFRVKWRADSTRSGMNSPRKEIVAYRMQRLFLDAEHYVLPPTRSRCFELDHYKKAVDPDARATFAKHSSCVFGTVSYWVEGAASLSNTWYRREPLFDKGRWQTDATYRRTLSDANLLTVLTLNGDTHSGNWLTVETGSGRHVYMIDSSISFTRQRNPSLDPVNDFSNVVVPLRKRTIERLMQLEESTLQGLLAVERVYAEAGWLRAAWVEPASLSRPSGEPYSFAPCPQASGCKQQMVLGLTPFEYEMMRDELWHLRARLDMGEIPLLEAAESR